MVLPSPCVVCDGELPWSNRVGCCCRECWEDLPRIEQSKCLRCATPWESASRYEQYVCIDCRDRRSELEWIDAWGRYAGGLERVLHGLKFERQDFMAEPLGELLFGLFIQRGDFRFDSIAAVPMHRRKLRERGYNQAELLGRAVAARAGIPFRADLLAKTANRQPQSTLPKEQRKANVRDAFAASGECGGISVLLVDDICTTGETLQACARELRRAGAARICALVVARA